MNKAINSSIAWLSQSFTYMAPSHFMTALYSPHHTYSSVLTHNKIFLNSTPTHTNIFIYKWTPMDGIN